MWESGAIPELCEREDSAPKTATNPLGGPNAPALRAKLREVVRAEVLPRLLRKIWARPAQVEPARLARLLIDGRNDAFRSEIGARFAPGSPTLAIISGVLASTARELGRLWDNDDCDLIDMQRAVGALKRWIAEITSETAARTTALSPSILVQATPGDSHTLAVDMAEALLRGTGWRVARGEARSFRDVLAAEWRDAIGFSLSCDRHAETLKAAIAEARAASRNPNLLVLVGGAVFVERPRLAAKLGADFCACTAEMTVQAPFELLNGINVKPS
jgi:methanogenic corrinoid protein MtbC1